MVVGATQQKLIIEVHPATLLTANGFIILTIPEYYEDAGQETMISQKEPTPCTCDNGIVLDCKFSLRNMQLLIQYEFTGLKPIVK